MLRISAETYINLGITIADFSCAFYAAELNLDMPLKEEDRTNLKQFLIKLKEHADKLKLKVSYAILNNKIDDIPQNIREFDLLIDVIITEIRSNLFIYIPSHKAKYHEFASTFIGPQKFPEASKELIKAGNCYALGENTASVFHSMRAVELGLRALAKHLNVTFPFPLELADWQNIIDKIEAAIKGLEQLPKSEEKDKELKYCSATASQFRYFKEAYRKHVMHVRENYDEYQAITIMEHTLNFVNSLSDKISE